MRVSAYPGPSQPTSAQRWPTSLSPWRLPPDTPPHIVFRADAHPAHAGARCVHQWRTSTHTLAKPTLRPVHTPSAPPAERYPRAGAGSGEIGLTSLFLISAAADCARPAGTGRSGWHSARSEWWMPRPPGGVRRAGLAGRWPRSRTGTRKCAARHRRGSR